MNIPNEQILCNFLSLQVREEKLGGREYLVAPVSMLVPGVLSGSKGALFYPKSEVVRNYQAWNFMPLTLGHPTDERGNATSARSPHIIEKYGLGFVFNTNVNKGKLDGEAWFDIDRTKAIAPIIIERLRSNQPIELSTGLFTANSPVKNGLYNGKPYTAIARDYQPDHLAVLPFSKGACSLEDGCGVLVNEDPLTLNIIRKLPNGKYRLYSKKGKNLGTFNSLEDAKKHEQEVEYFKHNEYSCSDPENCECDSCRKKSSSKKKGKKITKCSVSNLLTCPVTNAKKKGGGSNCGVGPGGFQRGNVCATGGAAKNRISASLQAEADKKGIKLTKTKDGVRGMKDGQEFFVSSKGKLIGGKKAGSKTPKPKTTGGVKPLSKKEALSKASSFFGKSINFGSTRALKDEDGNTIGTKISFPRGYTPRLKSGKFGEVFARGVEIIQRGKDFIFKPTS